MFLPFTNKLLPDITASCLKKHLTSQQRTWLVEISSNLPVCYQTRRLVYNFNPLKTKHRPLYLKIQSVPRCKHFSSRL